jgi:hypothetical protein
MNEIFLAMFGCAMLLSGAFMLGLLFGAVEEMR